MFCFAHAVCTPSVAGLSALGFQSTRKDTTAYAIYTMVALTEQCDEMVTECVRRGVMLFVTGRGFLKFTPPLNIEQDALMEAVDVVGRVIDQMLPQARTRP